MPNSCKTDNSIYEHTAPDQMFSRAKKPYFNLSMLKTRNFKKNQYDIEKMSGTR